MHIIDKPLVVNEVHINVDTLIVLPGVLRQKSDFKVILLSFDSCSYIVELIKRIAKKRVKDTKSMSFHTHHLRKSMVLISPVHAIRIIFVSQGY